MFKTLSDNLNILMAKARLSSSELARQIGVPATTIKRIRNNEQSNPTVITLLPVAQYFSVSLDQLIGNNPLTSHHGTCASALHKIPLLSWQECMHYEVLDYEKCSKQVFTERKVSAKAFALIINEDDLAFFPKGSILIIEPEQKLETGDYVIVANMGQNIASIRKYIIEIDQIYLKPFVAGMAISALISEYKILGVIIQYKMELNKNNNTG